MSEVSKKFPLPLSSVMGHAQKGRQSAFRQQIADTALRPDKERIRPGLLPSKTAGHLGVLASSSKAAQKGGDLIRGAVAMAEKIASQGITDKMVLSALSTVPRHFFVAQGFSQQAYADTALPIGHQQTISRPYIVARMIEAVRRDVGSRKLSKVLEIGTGCGYQAAVLSRVADEVYSIERIKALYELARSNLRRLRIPNLRLQYGDGMLGLPQAAPFEAIVVAAAGLKIPDALFSQLSIGGYMIAPVGDEKQTLQLTKRTGERQWQSMMLEDCYFVPLRQGVV